MSECCAMAFHKILADRQRIVKVADASLIRLRT